MDSDIAKQKSCSATDEPHSSKDYIQSSENDPWSSLICPFHEKETVNMYCLHHVEVLCSKCLQGFHNQCQKVVPLSEAACCYSDTMFSKDIETFQDIEKCLEEESQTTHNRRQKVKTNCDDVMSGAMQTSSGIKNHIDNLILELKRGVEAHFREEVSRLSVRQAILNALLDRIRKVQKLFQNSDGTAINNTVRLLFVARMKDCLRERLSIIKQPKYVFDKHISISMSPDIETLKETLIKIGDIHTEVTEVSENRCINKVCAYVTALQQWSAKGKTNKLPISNKGLRNFEKLQNGKESNLTLENLLGTKIKKQGSLETKHAGEEQSESNVGHSASGSKSIPEYTGTASVTDNAEVKCLQEASSKFSSINDSDTSCRTRKKDPKYLKRTLMQNSSETTYQNENNHLSSKSVKLNEKQKYCSANVSSKKNSSETTHINNDEQNDKDEIKSLDTLRKHYCSNATRNLGNTNITDKEGNVDITDKQNNSNTSVEQNNSKKFEFDYSLCNQESDLLRGDKPIRNYKEIKDIFQKDKTISDTKASQQQQMLTSNTMACCNKDSSTGNNGGGKISNSNTEVKGTKEKITSLRENKFGNLSMHQEQIFQVIKTQHEHVQLIKIIRMADLKLQGAVFLYNGVYLDNGCLLASDVYNRRVLMFSKDMDSQTELLLEYQPTGICCGKEQNTIHAICDFCYVVTYHLSDASLEEQSRFDIAPDAVGIARSRDTLITGHYYQIELHSLTGENLALISICGGDTAVCTTVDGCHMFHKDGNDVICETVENGNEMFRYSNTQLKYPHGMCCDTKNNLLVVGLESKNVHQITSDGKKCRILIDKLKSIQTPVAVCCHPKENIFVVTSRGEDTVMEVYQFLYN